VSRATVVIESEIAKTGKTDPPQIVFYEPGVSTPARALTAYMQLSASDERRGGPARPSGPADDYEICLARVPEALV
jgi:hypothetical protein